MIEPTMKATPPQKNRSSRISPAAARFRISPVIEIVFGVSRESISRLRALARHSAAVLCCARAPSMAGR